MLNLHYIIESHAAVILQLQKCGGCQMGTLSMKGYIMAIFFLVIIYLAFISLGLPDALLGTAWPVMRLEFGTPLEAAGLISMIIAGGTIVSSFASGAVVKRLGTGGVTFLSCVMTAGALMGFAAAPSYIWLLLAAVPLGLGAGSVDAALNNYVANHYKSYHMSWLHCFWGVGATISPFIMSAFIAGKNAWRGGYITVSTIQFGLAALLLITLPLWGRAAKRQAGAEAELHGAAESLENAGPEKTSSSVKPLKIKGVKLALIAFFFYCGLELTFGLWGSSFLVSVKGLPASTAAEWVSLYYGGITIGRFITGFITMKLSNRALIRLGQLTLLLGALLLVLPLPGVFPLAGFILIGLGCAPIYPCMLHETPVRFGKENSQAIMGYQMAFAYTGSTFLPPLLGWLASRTSMGILPFFILLCIAAMFIGSEAINSYMNKKQTANKAI